MWQEWFAWFPITTQKGNLRWLVTIERKNVPCYGAPNNMKFVYRDAK